MENEPPKDPHGYIAIFQGFMVVAGILLFLTIVALIVVGLTRSL